MAFARRIGPALLCAAGLLIAFHPMVLSGFARTETDPGDTRHLNYVLEHGFRWLLSRPGHRELWSPPVFFPEKNTAAYSETLLGVLPFYAPWRLLGAPPDTALQILVLALALLNFPASFFLLRHSLDLGVLASSMGAFLFSFGSPRLVHVGHQQLIAQFFTILAVIALVELFRASESPEGGSRRRAWIGLLFASLVAQAYACFYLAWFLALALALALTFAVAVPETRRRLFWLLSRHWLAAAACGVASFLAVAPLAEHYLEAEAVLERPIFRDAAMGLPPLKAWLNLGPYSWLYGSLGRPFLSDMPFEWEKRLGLGLVTMLAATYGLFRQRSRPGVRVLIATSAALFLLTASFPGRHTLWRWVFEFVPGATAMRAVSRVALILLVPASIGLACAFDRALLKRRGAWLPALAALVVLEQGQTMPSYDKRTARSRVAAVARSIPGGCEAFFAAFPESSRNVFETQLDAMWAGLETGAPTVNGYSSHLPPAWEPLYNNQVRGAGDAERLRVALRQWLTSRGRDPERACFVLEP